MDHKRKNDLLTALLILGFRQDKYHSQNGKLVFYSNGRRLSVDSWEMLEEWLRTKYYNSEVTKERVEFILWPERFERKAFESKVT